MRAHASNLAHVTQALRDALVLLERFEQASGSLPQRVVDVLNHGPASANTITVLVRKRRTDVAATLKLMAAAGQVVRDGQRWKLVED